MAIAKREKVQVPLPGGKFTEITIPFHPKSGRLPGWLNQRIRTFLKAKRGQEWDALCGVAQYPWFDHWGIVRYDDRDCLVSEPYGLGLAELEKVVRFCRTLNLQLNLSALGSHYPTQTMRLLFYPKEWEGDSDFQPRYD